MASNRHENRRGWDSNPRSPFEAHAISSRVPSATRTPLPQAGLRMRPAWHSLCAGCTRHRCDYSDHDSTGKGIEAQVTFIRAPDCGLRFVHDGPAGLDRQNGRLTDARTEAFALSILLLLLRPAGVRALILCLVSRSESVFGLQGERERRTGGADRGDGRFGAQTRFGSSIRRTAMATWR